jgi:hypothetical protein
VTPRISALASIVSGITLEAIAHAAEPIPASVRVDAPSSCATRASFWAALARRTDRLRDAQAGEDAAAIEVVIHADAASGTPTGELRIVRGEVTSSRVLTAASCEDLTQGMSLVAALAFDPTARLDPSSSPAPSPSPLPATAIDEPVAPRPPLVTPPPVRFGAGLSGGGSTLTNAVGTPALGVFLDARWERGLGTLVRVGFTRASSSVAAGSVEADLTFYVGRLSICPVRLPLDERATVSLLPCFGVDGGVLSPKAIRGITRAFDRDRAWLAPSAGAALEVLPVRPLFLEGRAAAVFPLIRDELTVNPTVQLYTAPVVALSVELSAGVRFP